ncbi:hypothetical protein F2P81_017631 [Scophthalmus maximus]|uniref:Uncharacterized protein n=1 Tax=Scophthalmus maximus TaxID=52904 RepID=A0A6A4SG91_SCOMX|nr:hypothetical protein F2P81_017631 [Scophthalmus maximus]
MKPRGQSPPLIYLEKRWKLDRSFDSNARPRRVHSGRGITCRKGPAAEKCRMLNLLPWVRINRPHMFPQPCVPSL